MTKEEREDTIAQVRMAFSIWESEFDVGDDWSEQHKARDRAIEALEKEPSADVIPVSRGATNGDVLKAIFPNIECREDRLGNVFVISDAQLGYIVFRESWWNAPYKGVEDEREEGKESE